MRIAVVGAGVAADLARRWRRRAPTSPSMTRGAHLAAMKSQD